MASIGRKTKHGRIQIHTVNAKNTLGGYDGSDSKCDPASLRPPTPRTTWGGTHKPLIHKRSYF